MDLLRKLVILLFLPLTFFLFVLERAMDEKETENTSPNVETIEYDLKNEDEEISFTLAPESMDAESESEIEESD